MKTKMRQAIPLRYARSLQAWLDDMPYRKPTLRLAKVFYDMGAFKYSSHPRLRHASPTQTQFVTSNALAEQAGVSQQAASKFLQKLEKDGYLTPYMCRALRPNFPLRETKLYILTFPNLVPVQTDPCPDLAVLARMEWPDEYETPWDRDQGPAPDFTMGGIDR